ncbi:MAG: hypothetical protein AUI14_09425 [Actinobacteria bacterium 13_2_20CM_2_71_6]|nr:MAG: hypothetical protein AUI14_09425 [Actinobacteria bacterium 13_2_20CM_2_71_6]
MDGHAVADVLAELAQRIDAHAEHNGCCGNGCNVRGWQLPFPCETRQFYEAVREHLSSSVDKAANTFAASEVDVQPDDGWAGG